MAHREHFVMHILCWRWRWRWQHDIPWPYKLQQMEHCESTYVGVFGTYRFHRTLLQRSRRGIYCESSLSAFRKLERSATRMYHHDVLPSPIPLDIYVSPSGNYSPLLRSSIDCNQVEFADHHSTCRSSRFSPFISRRSLGFASPWDQSRKGVAKQSMERRCWDGGWSRDCGPERWRRSCCYLPCVWRLKHNFKIMCASVFSRYLHPCISGIGIRQWTARHF